MLRLTYSILASISALLLLSACGGTQSARFSGSGLEQADISSISRVSEYEEGDTGSSGPGSPNNPNSPSDPKSPNGPDSSDSSSWICTAGQMTPAEAAQTKSKTPVVYNQTGGTIDVGYGAAYVKIYGNGNTIDIQVGGGALVIEIYGGGNSIVGGGGSSIIHVYGDNNTVDLNGGGSNILNFYGIINALDFAGGGCNSAYFTKGRLSVTSTGLGGNNVNGSLAVTKDYTLPL